MPLAIPTRRPFRELGAHPPWFHGAAITSLAVDPAGQLLAVASEESLALYSLATGVRVRDAAELERLAAAAHRDVPALARSRVVFDRDGRSFYAFARARGCAALWQWDVATGEIIGSWRGDDVGPILAARDQRIVMSTLSSGGRRVVLWDLGSRGPVSSAETAQHVTAADLARDGRVLLNGTRAGSVPSSWSPGPRLIEWWDFHASAGRLLASHEGVRHRDDPQDDWTRCDVEAVAIHPAGTLGLVARGMWPSSEHVALELIELASFRVHARLTPRVVDDGGEAAPEAVAFSPDGRFCAGGGAASGLTLFDLDSGERWLDVTAEAPGSEYGIQALTFTADGRAVVVGHEDGTLLVVDLGSRAVIAAPAQERESHAERVFAVCASRDGTRVASASRDGSLRLWSVERAEPLRAWPLEARPKALAFSRDADAIVDDELRAWPFAEGASPPAPAFGHDATCLAAAFDPTGRMLLRAAIVHPRARDDIDARVSLWTVETKQLARALPRPEYANVVALGSLGRRGVAGYRHHDPSRRHEPQQVAVWDLESGQLVRELALPVADHVALTPDESRLYIELYVSELERRHEVYDLESGNRVLVLDDATRALSAHAACPIHARMAGAFDGDSTITIWSLDTGAIVQRLEGHAGSVDALAFSADGRVLVSGGSDRIVRVWRIETE